MDVGFEDVTVVAVKISVIWDITLCSTVKLNQFFALKEHTTSIFRAKE
jgi:hypothetical protein